MTLYKCKDTLKITVCSCVCMRMTHYSFLRNLSWRRVKHFFINLQFFMGSHVFPLFKTYGTNFEVIW